MIWRLCKCWCQRQFFALFFSQIMHNKTKLLTEIFNSRSHCKLLGDSLRIILYNQWSIAEILHNEKKLAASQLELRMLKKIWEEGLISFGAKYARNQSRRKLRKISRLTHPYKCYNVRKVEFTLNLHRRANRCAVLFYGIFRNLPE